MDRFQALMVRSERAARKARIYSNIAILLAVLCIAITFIH